MSVATAHHIFKASQTIAQAQADAQAERFAQAPYQMGDILQHGGFSWSVVRISETGGGDLLYILEREDLPGSRWDVLVSKVK